MGKYQPLFRMLVLSVLLLSGCLMKPLSGGAGANTSASPQSGCAYQNPACDSGHQCVNNACVPATATPAANNTAANATANTTANASQPANPPGCAHNNPACGPDYECANNSCVEKTLCGKFGCQAGEDSAGCCADCGCPSGYACGPDNACSASMGEILIKNVSVVPISPVVLYTVPSKTIEKGVGPLIRAVLKNNGTAPVFGLRIKPEVQGYTGVGIYDVGSIAPGDSLIFNYTPAFNTKALAAGANSTAVLRLELQYSGGTTNRTSVFTAPIMLQPEDYFDWNVPEAVAGWADSDDPAVRDLALDATLGAELRTDAQKERAAREIFGHLQARSVQVEKRQGACYSDTLAFPADVLKARSGDCASLSVLFSACMEAAGMRTAIIKTPDAVLAAYTQLDGSLVPLDLRALDGSDLAAAREAGAAEASKSQSENIIIYPEDQWGLGVKKAMPGTLAPSSRITTTSQNCQLLSGTLTVNYWFSNDGYDAGRRCVNATVYKGSDAYASKRSCADVYLNDKKNVTFSITGLPTNMSLDAKCWLD
jgi:hypothetical protein